MDEKDRLLLTYLQNGLPLTPRPFAVWAAKLGTDSADLLVRIQRLKKEGTFGGIRAVLDPRAFHYQSAWVAAQFAPEEWETRTEILWQHPGVVYGCEREPEFNVWFFIAVPAGHDLELHVRCLEKIAGAQKILFLPVRRVYKGTELLTSSGKEMHPERCKDPEKDRTVEASDLMAPAGQERRIPSGTALKETLSAEDIGMIRALQAPFPITDEPYQKIAADIGITETQVIERMKSLTVQGCLKRIGSFLKSAVAAPEAGTLVVWQIPEEKLERSGPELAEFREVLYADRRPAYPEFPYSLYTMIRAETPEALELITRRMQDRIGKWPHRVMVTTRELKKTPVKYFPKDLDAWWQQSRHISETAFN